MVIGANTGGGQAFRTIMQRPAVVGTNGYVSVFVELFAWMGELSSHVINSSYKIRSTLQLDLLMLLSGYFFIRQLIANNPKSSYSLFILQLTLSAVSAYAV